MNDVELHQRAGELFLRVLDLEDVEAEALLSEAEQTAPEVAARARRMLVIDAESSGSNQSSDPAGLLGHTLGAYSVVELIGTGGMGAVYRAQRHDPDETVAIKFLPAFGASADLIARFQYERELLASFNHPGIVGFRHAGKTADGSLYLVMEFVEGEPLSPRRAAVRESVAKTVDFIIGTAAAVQYMHGRAALHRDLKPSNILIRSDTQRARPVLLDMGIARPLRDPDSDWASHTMGPVGTPAYMSPEQLNASPDVDVGTDVYGLGAVLFELLAGKPARGLGDLRSWDRAQVERLQSEPARPPSEVVDTGCFGSERAQQRSRQMRGDLDAIVVKALEHDPADRYPSVEAFSADLYRWLDQRPVVARPINAWGRVWRLMRRKPGVTLAVVTTVLALVTTSIVTSLSLRSERRARAALLEQVETTEILRRFITEDVFERTTPELDGPDTPAIELVRGAARSLDARLGDLPAVTVGMRGMLLAVFARMGDLDAAQAQVDAGWLLARKLPEDHAQRIEFELEAARLLEQRNLHAEAEQALLLILPRIARAEGSVGDLQADALDTLGLALYGQNRLMEARLQLRAALGFTEPGDARRYPILSNLAVVESELHGPEAALDLMHELLGEIELRFGPDHVWTMILASNLAGTYLELDQPEQALPYARRAVAIAEQTLEPTHGDRIAVLNALASCLSLNNELEEAILLRRQVLEGRRAIHGEQNIEVATAAMNLASTLNKAGRHTEALEPAEAAVGITLTVAGPAHPKTAQAYHALAAVLDQLGEREFSLEAFDHAIEIYSQAAGNHSGALQRARAQRAVAASR